MDNQDQTYNPVNPAPDMPPPAAQTPDAQPAPPEQDAGNIQFTPPAADVSPQYTPPVADTAQFAQDAPPPQYAPPEPYPGAPAYDAQQYAQPPYGQPYAAPYKQEPFPGSGKATAAFVLGLLSMPFAGVWFIGLGLGIAAVIMAIGVRKQMQPALFSLATAALVMGICGIAAGAVSFIGCVSCMAIGSSLTDMMSDLWYYM